MKLTGQQQHLQRTREAGKIAVPWRVRHK